MALHESQRGLANLHMRQAASEALRGCFRQPKQSPLRRLTGLLKGAEQQLPDEVAVIRALKDAKADILVAFHGVPDREAVLLAEGAPDHIVKFIIKEY